MLRLIDRFIERSVFCKRMKHWKSRIGMILALLLTAGTFTIGGGATGSHVAEAASANLMTKYRVYQYDKAIKEFATEAQAKAYAQYYSYSHVETIANRTWVWDNFPRYKVYQNGVSTTKLEFRTYNEALAAADKMTNAHIRDLQNIGWVYDTYAKYVLYQGDKTLPNWTFTTLDAAKKEAKKWGNAHIMELSTNNWVWDNLTDAQRKSQREATAVYEIFVQGEPVADTAKISFLQDAIKASKAIAGSEVMNTATGKVVHSNVLSYNVVQNGETIGSYISLDAAVAAAKAKQQAEVEHNGVVYWSGVPYLTVYQGEKKLKTYNTVQSAIGYAKYYANSSVRVPDGRKLWSYESKLVYLGWNGSSDSTTILNHVANTQGLNIDSPTWFELSAADGTLKDTSNAAVVKTLKEKGILVTPLVHNQFNRTMTTEFLKSSEAQTKFITALITKLKEIGAYGVNIDFEEVAAADRDAYTNFVKALTKSAHSSGLKVSIDLPRGDVSWNHKTAYDHAALGEIVDTIIIMAYDQHWKGSTTPGSVAGLKWTEDGVQQFLNYGIPRSKLMLGIPFYVREWKLDSSGKLVSNRAIFMKELPQLIADTKATAEYDSAFGQYKYTYVKDGFTYVFWAETEDTVKARIAIAKKYSLAGVAAWRLGYESGSLWEMMLRNK